MEGFGYNSHEVYPLTNRRGAPQVTGFLRVKYSEPQYLGEGERFGYCSTTCVLACSVMDMTEPHKMDRQQILKDLNDKIVKMNPKQLRKLHLDRVSVLQNLDLRPLQQSAAPVPDDDSEDEPEDTPPPAEGPIVLPGWGGPPVATRSVQFSTLAEKERHELFHTALGNRNFWAFMTLVDFSMLCIGVLTLGADIKVLGDRNFAMKTANALIKSPAWKVASERSIELVVNFAKVNTSPANLVLKIIGILGKVVNVVEFVIQRLLHAMSWWDYATLAGTLAAGIAMATTAPEYIVSQVSYLSAQYGTLKAGVSAAGILSGIEPLYLDYKETKYYHELYESEEEEKKNKDHNK